MVAYNFQPRFELSIVTLAKLGTIRAAGRRRHAQPGDALQLYTGMRTRGCRLIARACCERSDIIRMSFENDFVQIERETFRPGKVFVDEIVIEDLDGFARGDGFAGWSEMKAFWLETHGPNDFGGRWIQWSAESVRVAA